MTFAGRFIRLGAGGGGIRDESRDRLVSTCEVDIEAMFFKKKIDIGLRIEKYLELESLRKVVLMKESRQPNSLGEFKHLI